MRPSRSRECALHSMQRARRPSWHRPTCSPGSPISRSMRSTSKPACARSIRTTGAPMQTASGTGCGRTAVSLPFSSSTCAHRLQTAVSRVRPTIATSTHAGALPRAAVGLAEAAVSAHDASRRTGRDGSGAAKAGLKRFSDSWTGVPRSGVSRSKANPIHSEPYSLLSVLRSKSDAPVRPTADIPGSLRHQRPPANIGL